MKISRQYYFMILIILFSVEWIALAIKPVYRDDWMLENILVIVAVVVIFGSYKKLVLSRVSYTLIYVFLSLHVVGSHYTYTEVPYELWFNNTTGYSLNALLGWERNNFDRLIHFCYGLLLTYPIREIILRLSNVMGFWSYFFPLILTMASSMMYEFLEWAVAELFYQELGMAYLGTQGDIWDGHKDMALASLGALIVMIFTIILNAYLQRDFISEWKESLRVRHAEPHGENDITRLK